MNKLSPRKVLLLIWVYVHFGILVFSYSGISYFNGGEWFRPSKVWPFVTYAQYENKFIETRMVTAEVSEGYRSDEKEMTHFYGLFRDYDITEFLAYTLIGLIIFRFTKQKK